MKVNLSEYDPNFNDPDVTSSFIKFLMSPFSAIKLRRKSHRIEG